MDEKPRKKTMGRRKIEIKKIEDKSRLQVTSSKRRMSLFKKACELSVVCGAEVAVLAMSPAKKKIYAFGNPSVDSVLERFQTSSSDHHQEELIVSEELENSSRSYAEAVWRLEEEKNKEIRKLQENNYNEEKSFWWEELPPLEGMELYQLEGVLEALEGLKNNVKLRVEEIQKSTVASSSAAGSVSSWNPSENSTLMDESVGYDLIGGLPFDFNDQDFQDFCNDVSNSFIN